MGDDPELDNDRQPCTKQLQRWCSDHMMLISIINKLMITRNKMNKTDDVRNLQ